MDNICAGAILLLRRITTCLVLVALIGIYAAPLAAAFVPNGMDCCAAGMCPRAGHSMTHRRAHQEMPDCGMGSHSGSMRECKMGACDSQKDTAVNAGLFVLSAPTQIVRSTVQIPVAAPAPEPEHTVSQIPKTPPPRTSLS